MSNAIIANQKKFVLKFLLVTEKCQRYIKSVCNPLANINLKNEFKYSVFFQYIKRDSIKSLLLEHYVMKFFKKKPQKIN